MGGEKFKYFAYSGIAIFILAIIYFVVAVYTTMVNGESRSQYEFSAFIQQAEINTYSDIQTAEEHKQFFNTVQYNIDANSYIVAAVMQVADKPIFAYPISSNVIQIIDGQNPTLLASSPMLKTYSMSIPNQNGHHVVFNAVTYILRPQDIYNAARVSFLIVLAYILALIVCVVYMTLTNKSHEVAVDSTDKAEEDFSTDDATQETISVVFREQESSWDEFFVDEDGEQKDVNKNIESIQEDIQKTDDSADYIDNNTEDDVYVDSFVEEYIEESKNDDSNLVEPQEEHFAEYEETTTEIVEDSTVSQITDPMGLFSDITGVGWESYMETRLDSELIRAASSEQDLALLFIQLKGIENSVVAKKKIATLLLDYFKYRDFVFEYKDDGFAGILLDVNLDQTMVLSEQLYRQIQSILNNEGLYIKVGIGVSTRALRILPGSRIITEAEQAVARAFEEDELPIVAFRVSPEKYRQFVSNTTT